VAALFGHDPSDVVLNVNPDDGTPSLASAATNGLDQRISGNEAEINAEFYRWIEQVLLQQPYPPTPGSLVLGHGLVSITAPPVVADAKADDEVTQPPAKKICLSQSMLG